MMRGERMASEEISNCAYYFYLIIICDIYYFSNKNMYVFLCLMWNINIAELATETWDRVFTARQNFTLSEYILLHIEYMHISYHFQTSNSALNCATQPSF